MLFFSSSLLLPLSRVDIHLDLILKHIFQSIFNYDVILATLDTSFLNCLRFFLLYLLRNLCHRFCCLVDDNNLDFISLGPITSTLTDTHLP